MITLNHWNLTIKELSEYGSKHSDPLVQELARLVGNIAYYAPYDCDVEEFFEDPFNRLREIENDYSNLREDNKDLEQDKLELSNRVDALRCDLDANEQAATITDLKARIMAKNDHIKDLNAMIDNRDELIQDLKKEAKELEDKLNFWNMLNKEHSY